MECRNKDVFGMNQRLRRTVRHPRACPAEHAAQLRTATRGSADASEFNGILRNRFGRGDSTDRGAVAVEAALIFPVLVLMLFGIIEFSLFLRDHVALSAAVRSGARTASAEPRMSTFSTDAAGAVLRAGTGMPFSTVEEMWVYEANAGGYPTNGGSTSGTTGSFTSCTTNCLVFHYSGSSFTQSSGSWSHTLVNACPGDAGMTNVGVFIKANHRFVSGIFGNTVDITDHAVLRFEPIPASQLLQSGQCNP